MACPSPLLGIDIEIPWAEWAEKNQMRTSVPHVAHFVIILVSLSMVLPVAAYGASIIVAFKGEGPHRSERCAEYLMSHQLALATGFADGSDSLDETNRRHGVDRYEAIFRRPTPGPAQAMRAHLAQRILHKTEQQRRGNRDAAASASDATSALFDVYRIESSADGDASALLEELQNDPHVAFAQLDYSVALDQTEGPDPFLSSSGSWGQPHADLWGLHAARVPEAWSYSRGEGIIVAVIDSGLEYTHPDIADNVWINRGEDLDDDGVVTAADFNGIDDDLNGFVDDLRGYDFAGYGADLDAGSETPGSSEVLDVTGHGTHVAGTVAAVADNGIGIAGVAPRSRVMPVKVFPEEGPARTSDVWRGVLYAAANGARVINASFSCGSPCPENPTAERSLEVLEAMGVVYVTSAGNTASDVLERSPENQRGAVTVGAHGVDDERSASSSFGWLLDLLAPGGGPSTPSSVRQARRNILSLRSPATQDSAGTFAVEELYERRSGTSMAAPHISGAVANLLSFRPDLTPAEVRRLLRYSARTLSVPGHDPDVGAGALDMLALLTTPLPALELRIDEPRPGSVLNPVDDPVLEIRGEASGDDLAGVEVSFAAGVRGRAFSSDGIEVVEGVEAIEASETIEAVDQSESDEQGVIARWDTTDLPDGPYVVRLRAQLRDGTLVDEYTIVGLERTSPRLISASGVNARRPTISGSTVVWDQEIPESENSGEQDEQTRSGVGIAKFPFLDEEASPSILISLPGNVTSPRIHQRRVVWTRSTLDASGEQEFAVEGCRIRRKVGAGPSCTPPFSIPQSFRPFALRPFRKLLMWRETVNPLFDVRGCRMRGGSDCRPVSLLPSEPEVRSRRLLDFDGHSLVWDSLGARSRLEFCALPGQGETCEPKPVLVGGQSISVATAAIDKNLLALVVSSGLRADLAYCKLDAATGECDAQLIGEIVQGSEPVVSKRRIVWSEPRDEAPQAVVYCELDEETGACPAQRLAGAPAWQGEPHIDRNRVVWRDQRGGRAEVRGVELPWLAAIQNHQVKAGRSFTLPIRFTGVDANAESFRLEAISGAAPTDFSPRFVRFSDRKAALGLRPRLDVEGRSVWRLVATAPTGLETTRRIEILVKPRIPQGVPEPRIVMGLVAGLGMLVGWGRRMRRASK